MTYRGAIVMMRALAGEGACAVGPRSTSPLVPELDALEPDLEPTALWTVKADVVMFTGLRTGPPSTT